MLMDAFAVFTLVAVLGLAMFRDIWHGYAMDPALPIVHGAASLLGSALVIVAALQSDARVYINLAMAVVSIAPGLTMGYAKTA